MASSGPKTALGGLTVVTGVIVIIGSATGNLAAMLAALFQPTLLVPNSINSPMPLITGGRPTGVGSPPGSPPELGPGSPPAIDSGGGQPALPSAPPPIELLPGGSGGGALPPGIE